MTGFTNAAADDMARSATERRWRGFGGLLSLLALLLWASAAVAALAIPVLPLEFDSAIFVWLLGLSAGLSLASMLLAVVLPK
jgi:hypothetical protein